MEYNVIVIVTNMWEERERVSVTFELGAVMKASIWAVGMVVALLARPGGVNGAIVRVPGDVPTIADGVSATGPGDTVLVAPGVYPEHSVYMVDYGRVIMSEAGPEVTTIVGTDPGMPGIWLVWLSAPDDTITLFEGFTVDGVSGYTRLGLNCSGRVGSRPLVTNNIIVGPVSVKLENGTEAIVRNNTILCLEGGEAAAGVMIDGASPTVMGNIISGTGWGIMCGSGSNPSVVCNNVWGNEDGNYHGLCEDLTGIDGNISEDPLFCDRETWDFRLDCQSPCVDGYGCGQIGALGVGCGATRSDHTTWGVLKQLCR